MDREQRLVWPLRSTGSTTHLHQQPANSERPPIAPEAVPETAREGAVRMKNIPLYRPRHSTAPKPFTPPQLQTVLDETAAFSLLVAQTKRGNGTAVWLLDALFGEDALGNARAA